MIETKDAVVAVMMIDAADTTIEAATDMVVTEVDTTEDMMIEEEVMMIEIDEAMTTTEEVMNEEATTDVMTEMPAVRKPAQNLNVMLELKKVPHVRTDVK